MRGEHVRTVQCALHQKGFSPGDIDGVYGGDTEAAVTNFQLAFSLTVDGEVGPETAKRLEVGWPIDTSLAATLCSGNPTHGAEQDDQDFQDDDDLRGVPNDIEMAPDTASITIEASGRDYWAEHKGQRFFVGTKVPYGSYWGLYQKGSDLSKLGGGRYNPGEAFSAIGNWAHVLHPTILGESSGYFGRLNTYDRARFTFGCFQMAAHTAGDNLILLFREMLKLPEAMRYFPDLALVDGLVHKRLPDGSTETLENEVYSQKYKETQLPDFMEYLNPTLDDVEQAEAMSAARLMLWTAEHRSMRDLQVAMARDTITKKIGYAKSQGLDIMSLPIPLAVWCMDLRHQGRARVSEIKKALSKSNKYESLKWCGRSQNHKSRVNTVDSAIQKLIDDYPSWSSKKLGELVE
jgi:hypothetical protein